MAWSLARSLGLALCCGHALYFLFTSSEGDGYLGRGSLSLVAGLETDKHRDEAATLFQRQVQHAAVIALKKLYNDDDSPFATPFSTVESVLAEGFPLSWHPCTLQPLLKALEEPTTKSSSSTAAAEGDSSTKDYTWATALSEPLHLVVLGGSSSAHAAKRCSYDTPATSTSTNRQHDQNATASNTHNKEPSTVGTGDFFAGRYSNILLEQLLHRSTLHQN